MRRRCVRITHESLPWSCPVHTGADHPCWDQPVSSTSTSRPHGRGSSVERGQLRPLAAVASTRARIIRSRGIPCPAILRRVHTGADHPLVATRHVGVAASASTRARIIQRRVSTTATSARRVHAGAGFHVGTSRSHRPLHRVHGSAGYPPSRRRLSSRAVSRPRGRGSSERRREELREALVASTRARVIRSRSHRSRFDAYFRPPGAV